MSCWKMLFHSKLFCFIENPYTSLCAVCTNNKPLTHFLTPVEATWFCQAYHVRLAASHIASPSDRLQPNNTATTKQHIQLIHKQPKKCNNKQQQQQQQPQQQQHAKHASKMQNMQTKVRNPASNATHQTNANNIITNKCKNIQQIYVWSHLKHHFCFSVYIHASSLKGYTYKANGALYHPRA